MAEQGNPPQALSNRSTVVEHFLSVVEISRTICGGATARNDFGIFVIFLLFLTLTFDFSRSTRMICRSQTINGLQTTRVNNT